jgi:glutamyl-tRNA synthetase/glutamyl-Q tRNA(Asp) synthetase
VSQAARPDPRALPAAPATRFAPAPTGRLHLGHLANAAYVWGVSRAAGGSVTLRIEDHDRQRSRATYERDLLDDLDALGLRADRPSTDELRGGPSPFRQSDSSPRYAAALERLREHGLAYACDCARSTYAAWTERHGSAFSGPGCPGGCRERDLVDDGRVPLRVHLGGGEERWVDLLLGPMSDSPARAGDPLARDRDGNWTYAFCVVVDDLEHGIDLVIRGRDLLDATAGQLRLARLVGRETPPTFLHHPLIRRPDGSKLSKAEGDTSIRSLLATGRSPADLFGEAAAAVGLIDAPRPVPVEGLTELFR